jgi:molecular chaperone GrpE (heat shock protein)
MSAKNLNIVLMALLAEMATLETSIANANTTATQTVPPFDTTEALQRLGRSKAIDARDGSNTAAAVQKEIASEQAAHEKAKEDIAKAKAKIAPMNAHFVELQAQINTTNEMLEKAIADAAREKTDAARATYESLIPATIEAIIELHALLKLQGGGQSSFNAFVKGLALPVLDIDTRNIPPGTYKNFGLVQLSSEGGGDIIHARSNQIRDAILAA